MKQKEYIMFSGLIFAIVAVMHLFRMIYGVTVTFGTWEVPVWVSGLGILLAGFMAWQARKLGR